MRRSAVYFQAGKQRALRRPAVLGWIGSAVLTVCWASQVGGEHQSANGLAPSDVQAIPLALTDGHGECVLATHAPGDQFYLIVGSLEKETSTHVRVSAEGAAGPEFIPLARITPDLQWQARLAEQARRLELQRRQRSGAEFYPALAVPPPRKTFHIFMGDRDLSNPAQYQAIDAELHALGERVQVYLDRNDRDIAGIAATSAEILRVFNEDVAPWAAAHLGRVSDVDRDGRFTILMTSKLGALQNGRVRVDGFVRGSDFFRELPAPFSNRCDMLYLNAALKPGPQLRAVLAHEFTHAVTFCEHGLRPYDDKATYLDEESWLSEGLAHLVECRRELGWSNLDYRMSAFLAEPERCPLIVPDYFGTGMWRHPGMRGAALLFLRSCFDRADADLPKRLIQSPLRGIANLETATQQPFTALFRQAAVDLLQPRNYGHLSPDGTGMWLCGPRFRALALGDGSAEATISPTAAAFFLLHSSAAEFARIRIEASGPVQVTLVRAPADLPRLSLRWTGEADNPCLELTAHRGALKLRRAGWEGAAAENEPPFAPWLDGKPIRPEESIRSRACAPAAMQGSKALFKVWGEDMQGRPLAAWLEAKGE